MDLLKFTLGVSSLIAILATFMMSYILTRMFWSAANYFLFK
jgi:hypothetical protein